MLKALFPIVLVLSSVIIVIYYIIIYISSMVNFFNYLRIFFISHYYSFLYETVLLSFCFISTLSLWLKQNDMNNESTNTAKTIIQYLIGYSIVFQLLFIFIFGYLVTFNSSLSLKAYYSLQ